MALLGDLPARVPQQSWLACIILVLTSCVTSTVSNVALSRTLVGGADMTASKTLGFDGSMMNGLNILPSYTDYFTLTTATLALNTASVWVGSAIAGLGYAKVPDWIGRKWALFFGAVSTILGVILQTAAQSIAMFVIARIIIGFGTGASSIAAPVYLSETVPVKLRAVSLALLYDFWYVGKHHPFGLSG